MSESHTTTDHDQIKKWIEERDGVPTTVKETEQDGHAGISESISAPGKNGWRRSAGTSFSKSSTRPDWHSYIRMRRRTGR